jgi:hypothetical protein
MTDNGLAALADVLHKWFCDFGFDTCSEDAAAILGTTHAFVPLAEIAALRAALDEAAFALGFHNRTPTGRTRSCLPHCVACAALATAQEADHD